ncbi:MAG: flagellar biosynthetic protein FliR [Lachnospiraceae bacterium]|nr:flagellar biosynthetic protein FliR [Lachnospiraceae bacterium]
MDLSISTLKLEAFLLVYVRCAAFCVTAPLFSHQSVNRKLRVLIAFFIALSIFTPMELALPVYDTVLEFTILVVKEALVGLSIGFVARFVMSIIVMAGEFIDREMGFTMSTNFDQSQGAMVTITAELYDKMVYLIILITNMHLFILKAIAQSFELIPVGHPNIHFAYMYTTVIGFIGEYFSIGFRIAMPIFIGIMMLNVILGVLAKSSPQMNMFAVGMQLKVLCGLGVFSVTLMFIPNITDYLVERMQDMVNALMMGMG